MEMTRRGFVKAGVAGAALGSGSLMTGAAVARASEAADEQELVADETRDCDIVVVGSGGGGMCAAVEAAEGGASVIVLESQETAGGSFNFTIGIMGANSEMVKALGESQNVMDIVNSGLELAMYTVDALKWIDLVNASGENISWLIDHGCKFQDPISYWYPTNPCVYHQWEKDFYPREALVPAAEAAGAEFLLSTAGKKLITDDEGAVVGIYAEKADGSILQINCKAVILACGGWLNDDEKVRKFTRGRDYYLRGLPAGRDGSGIRMAEEVGARSTSFGNSVMGWPAMMVENDMAWYDAVFMYVWGKSLCLNQDGARFVNEGMVEKATSGPYIHAFMQQHHSYVLFDSALAEATPGDLYPDRSVKEMLDGAVDAGEEHVWRADTFEELFGAAGLDVDTFMEGVNGYLEDCRNGEDSLFQKNPEMLVEFTQPPYYMAENTIYVSATLANLDYDRHMRVVDEKLDPIPGLYVAGVDGAQLYGSFYGLERSGGSCNANNVNSGRVAAQTAIADFEIA